MYSVVLHYDSKCIKTFNILFCKLLFFRITLRLLLIVEFQFVSSQRIFLFTFHPFLPKKFISKAAMATVLEENKVRPWKQDLCSAISHTARFK